MPTVFAAIRRIGLIAVFSFLAGGCVLAREEAVEVEEDVIEERVPPAKLQRMVMDFSDQYISALGLVFDRYLEEETDLARRVNAQKWRVMLGMTAMTIAGEQDPRAGLLDMAVFISAGKWAVGRYWIPEVFGEKAESLRAVYDEMDRRVWADVAKVLTPAQMSDLRGLIAAWEKSDPPRNELLDVRLRNLDGVELEKFAEARSARGLLAGVKRLWGRVDLSMLYGERMIFYMERAPRMFAQQSDLTIDRVAERFPIATVNPDFGALSDMAANLSEQINGMLGDQAGGIGKSLPEIRASLESAERLTLTLRGTFDSANLLAEKVEGLPFRTEDYAKVLEETSASLTQLNGIIMGINQMLEGGPEGEPKAVQFARVLDGRADALLDKAFQRGLILLGVFFAGVILSLLAAKVIFERRQPGRGEPASGE